MTKTTVPSSVDRDLAIRRSTLKSVALLIAVAATLLTPLVHLSSSNPLETWCTGLVAVIGWLGYILIEKGFTTYIPHLLVYSVLTVASMSVLAFGSVRTAGGFLFVAAVAGAGIFLGRAALMGSVVYSIVSLGALTLAESRGLLHAPDYTIGAKVWLTHSTVLITVAVLVFYSRQRASIALAQQREELQRRKRTEQERDRSNERFARIFRTSPSAMLAQSAVSGAILDMNPAFERCYGYTREQLLGQTDTVLWAEPEQRIIYVKNLAANQRTEPFRAIALRGDGSRFEALISSELGDDSEDRLVITTIVDMTKERQYEAVLASLASGIVGDSGEGMLHTLCEHMAIGLGAHMTGIAEQRDDGRMQTLAVFLDGRLTDNYVYDLEGTPCADTMGLVDLCAFPRDADKLFPDDKPLVEGGFEAYTGHSLLDADGSSIGLIHALWRHPAGIDSQSRALMKIYASQANAELMRMRRDREIQNLNQTLDQRVRERTAELQKLNAELDSFAYSVSHDLKSPLRAIDGFTHLLQESLEGRLQTQEQEAFQRILAATQRMAKLIADLLALARVSQGALSIGRVNLSEMALDILQEEQGQQGARRLHWRVVPDLVVQCDERLLRIALENLIGNAVKYTRDQPEPMIEFGCLDEPGQAPHFFVRDNGCGFDMAHADRLFKPFQRLHMPSSGFEGTGIGLATVRRIVERHGGSISGVSAPDHGATFSLTLGTAAAPCGSATTPQA